MSAAPLQPAILGKLSAGYFSRNPPPLRVEEEVRIALAWYLAPSDSP